MVIINQLDTLKSHDKSDGCSNEACNSLHFGDKDHTRGVLFKKQSDLAHHISFLTDVDVFSIHFSLVLVSKEYTSASLRQSSHLLLFPSVFSATVKVN